MNGGQFVSHNRSTESTATDFAGDDESSDQRRDQMGRRLSRDDEPVKLVRDEKTKGQQSRGTKSLKESLLKLAHSAFPRLVFIRQPVSVGEVVFYPFPKRVLSENNSYWFRMAKSLQVENKSALLTQFGKHVPEAEMRAFAKTLATKSSGELGLFERAELLDEDEYRGLFDPYMYLARIIGYQPKFYGATRLPEWACPGLPSFSPIRLEEVQIRERHANTGFWWLKPLFPRVREDNTLYKDVLLSAGRWAERVLAMSHPGFQSVLAMSPPIAVYARHQSGGRPVQAVSKTVELNGARFDQPLQLELEGNDWYACGDREHRLEIARKLIDGKPGTAICDGDDFCVRLGNAIMNGDCSQFDASVRKDDIMGVWTKAVLQACQCDERLKQLYLATQLAGFAPLETSVGECHRPLGHGVTSGGSDTHIKDSYIEYSRVQCAKPWSSVPEVISKMAAVGAIMKPESQIITKRSVLLAKTYCDGDLIFGSIVRGVYALWMREDVISTAEYRQEDEDARVVQIVANSYGHPLWNDLVSWVKRVWDIRSSHSIVKRRAEEFLDKTRTTRKWSGKLERKAIDEALAALS